MATIRIIKGRIYYHFRFKGVKCTERSGLEASPENVKRAQKFIQLIDAEIANEIFQYERHFPHGAKIQHFAPQRADLPFNRYFADWMAGKVLKETTRRNWESVFWKHLYPFFKDRPISKHHPGGCALLSAPPGGQGPGAQHHQCQAHEGAADDAA